MLPVGGIDVNARNARVSVGMLMYRLADKMGFNTFGAPDARLFGA